MKALHIPGPGPYYTNSFLLCSDEGHAVIIDPAADLILYQKALEQQKARLDLILLTHGHFDHVYSLEPLRKATGAKVLASRQDLLGDESFPISTADGELVDGQIIALDELKFKCWHTPGHSPGSFCFLCGELFFTGDTLFAGGIGRTDLEGGSFLELEKSLERLSRLPIPESARVLPGHGPFSTFGREKKTNDFMQY